MKALHRFLTLGSAFAGLAATACAQFDGPTPLAWRWLPLAVDYAPTEAPLILNDTVYLAAKDRIFALDAASGNEKWKYPLEGAKGGFKPQPVLAAGILVDVTDSGYIYGVTAATGKQAFEPIEIREEGRKFQILGQPVAVGDVVMMKRSDGSLMAFDPASGKMAWEKAIKIETGFNGPILAYQTNAIFADNNNQMYSVNITGKINWKQRFGNLLPDLQPTLYGENIYLYSGPYLACVSAVRGAGKWQVNLGQNMDFGPAVSGTDMACVTRDGKVYFFDMNGRRALREVIDLGSGPAAQPAAIGSKYLIPTISGALNLVDPKNGQTLWSYVVRPLVGIAQRADAKPVNVGGIIIDNRILTVQAAGRPILSNGTLYVMAEDASLLAFNSNLGVDLTPPGAEMLFPPMGAQTPGTPPLQFVFKVSDEATGVKLSSLKIDVDGVPLDFIVGKDEVASAQISYEGKNKPLTDGRHTLNVTVSDWMGNETKKSFAIFVDNSLPPLGAPAGLKPGTGGGTGRRGKGGGGGLGGGGG